MQNLVGTLGAAAAALVMGQFLEYVYRNYRMRKNEMKSLSESSRYMKLRIVAAVRALVAVFRGSPAQSSNDTRLDDTVFQTREVRRPL
jgi:hypothetical protein